jgi:formylglycine-generating enzyme required for sulfatase activity
VAHEAKNRYLKDKVWLPPGEFSMGSNIFYPEHRPVRRVTVECHAVRPESTVFGYGPT